jgi:hypothetical protein
MPSSRGPRISIALNGETGQFMASMDPAIDKLRKLGNTASETGGKLIQMGNQSRTSLLQTSAVVRSLEGNFQSNTRAISQFLTNTLKLGPIIQAAFPVLGVILLGKAVVDTTEKFAKMITEMSQSSKRVSDAFREINVPLRETNDELRLANERIAMDIAKLEGKRVNGLQTMLNEAAVAADKLADALDKDIKKVAELLKEKGISGISGWVEGLLGIPGTGDVTDRAKLLMENIRNITESYKDKIAFAPTMAAQHEQEAARDKEIYKAFTDDYDWAAIEIKKINDKYTLEGERGLGGLFGTQGNTRWTALTEFQKNLSELTQLTDLSSQNLANTEKQTQLHADRINNKGQQPIVEYFAKLKAELAGLQGELEAVGTNPWAEALARGAKNAAEAISRIDSSLNKATRMTPAERSDARILEEWKAVARTAIEIDNKTNAAIRKINAETQAYRELASAIGHGQQAEMQMRIEAKVGENMVGTGLKPGDPGYSERAEKFRQALTPQVGTQLLYESEKAAEPVVQQIHLLTQLAEVERLGEAEVRKFTAAQMMQNAELKYGPLAGYLLGVQEVTEYYKKLEVEANKRIAQLNLETTANQKLAAATLQSAEAARLQRLESEYAKLKVGGASDQEIAAKRAEDQSAYELKIAESAARRLEVYRADVTELQRERSVLQAMVNAGQDIVAAKKAQRDIDDEILKKEVQQALAMGTLRDGMRAFFLEMQEQGKKFSQIIYDELNSALDKISDQLAKLFTGQKTSFAKMLQGIGESLTKDAIKKGLQTGLGALGGVLPKQGGILGKIGGIIGGVGQKPDGSSPARALWVRLTGGGGGASQGESGTESAESPVGIGTRASPLGGLPSAIGSIPGLTAQGAVAAGRAIWHALSGLFGSGSGTAVSSSISYGGALAGGGDVSPGMSYIVGENAPEIFQPRSSGRVIPIDRFMGNGGGGTTYIDARWSDIGVANRLLRITDHNDRSVLSSSVVANHDRAQRTPTRRTG